ncbi:isovaleryl-CoA dehydrogenase [Oceanibacterium hippocampi]|uniref:Putative acyl-CoA dehydrogenase AidB n=1 Tax=Oceanibacterium hippocampi TaxID=745714 RepID=A0A1Y5RT58_9PROT|nr:isovaleryl-CoA dehydrogenase [Oceanibacterium hippocampi]SLN24436.1 Putative acyl-CoA dehydrogenase AidB [Oceanibacterium hippocampi]
MSDAARKAVFTTHEVLNQPPPFEDVNLFDGDLALGEALRREGGDWAWAEASRFGARCGSAETRELARLANRHEPELKLFDRFGHRIDEVEFHPAYHRLMQTGIGAGCSALAWDAGRDGAHVARAARFYLHNLAENGTACPITMTHAALPALENQPELAAEWRPAILSRDYDPRSLPVAEKAGATIGMAMTEKQGGSDVRANSTRAERVAAGGPGGEYLLTGHKWFCSAPMCDAFLTLAHTEQGLSCFLVPRWLPDGNRNRFLIQRLKDKLGNRSNASSEIEYDRTWCRMIGEEGRGVATIINMVHHTRLDCIIGSAAIMRGAVAEALHHTAYRSAFQRHLIEQPLMRNVLADLALEQEAAVQLFMRLARAYDQGTAAGPERLFARIATAVGKYWVCKRTPAVANEALECLGGAGYVEEGPMARLYREAPLNAIWEGSGNVICLDVLRAIQREPESLEVLLGEIASAAGADRRFDAALAALKEEFADLAGLEGRARRVVERLAVTLQASLLIRNGPPAVADGFVASRLSGDGGALFGSLPPGLDIDAIVERARPQAVD